LKQLSEHQGLSQFDKGFCYALFLEITGDSKLKLSPKQQAEFDKIYAKMA
jgi:hypothetical protein